MQEVFWGVVNYFFIFISPFCCPLLYQSIGINQNINFKTSKAMYLDNNDFVAWMEKLSKKLNDIGQDLKSLINTSEVFDKDEKILDN